MPRLSPFTGRFVQAFVDARDLFDPSGSFAVIHVEDVLGLPVEVVRDVGYLLAEPSEGVAGDPPSEPTSTSISVSHSGHCTRRLAVLYSLICR